MIIINVSQVPGTGCMGGCDYRAVAEFAGITYATTSHISQRAIESVVSQLATFCDDQAVIIEYETVTIPHRSLWALAGIKTRDEQKRVCRVCHSPVTGTSVYCSPKCRQRASRAKREAV